MANLSGIFLIIQFLYAVLGMQLFGKVTQGDYLTNLTLALTLALTLTKGMVGLHVRHVFDAPRDAATAKATPYPYPKP